MKKCFYMMCEIAMVTVCVMVLIWVVDGMTTYVIDMVQGWDWFLNKLGGGR